MESLSKLAALCSEITVILAAVAMLVKPLRNKMLGLDKLTDALCKTHGLDCSYGFAMRRVVHHARHTGFVKRIMRCDRLHPTSTSMMCAKRNRLAE